jgi:hypothetical protein
VLALTCVCCGTHLPLTVGSPAAAQEKSTTPSDEDLVPGAIMRLSSECSTLAKFDAGPPPRFVVPAQCAEAAREANRNTEAEYIAKHDQLSQSVTIRNCLKAKGIASLDEAIKDQDQTDRVTSCLASVRRADGAAAVDAPPIEYITPVNALITGDKLYSACQSQNEEDRGVCFGYVMGVSDALSSPNGLFGLYACLGKGVKVGALRDIVVKFLAEHEVKRHLAAATLLTEALAERFPCPGHHFVAKRRSVSQEDQINQMLDSIDPHVSGWGPPKALDGTH